MRQQIKLEISKEMLIDLLNNKNIVVESDAWLLNILLFKEELSKDEEQLLKALAKAPPMPLKLTCPACEGRKTIAYFCEGAKDNTYLHTCSICHGAGFVMQRQEG